MQNAKGSPELTVASGTLTAMTTYGYARVSTRKQDVAGQLEQLRAAGVDDDNIRTEPTTTGAGRLPVLDALVDELDDGDVLVVTALARFGRVGRRLIEFVEDLTARGIGVRTLQDGIDTTHPVAGPLQLFVFAALAESERMQLIERTRAGLAAARAAGRRGGRPTVITKDKLDVAQGLIAGGSTIAAAARVIGVSRPTLSRHLTST